jgi:glycosyltransferase involved in cell wall biosynthesis
VSFEPRQESESHTPLRVAILGSRGFPSTYGGFETFVRRIAPALASRGHQVTIYCRDRPVSGRRVWEVDGIRCIWSPGRDTKSLSTLSFGLTSHLDASFRSFDAALVLNVANGFFLPFLRSRQIPTALNTDGLEWRRGKWGTIARRVFYQGARMSARFADVLISDSKAIADIWQEEFSIGSTFIPYGADIAPDVGSDRVRALGLAPTTYVLVVARLIPENNVDLTLDALATLRSVPAVIVGSANYPSQLESRLTELDGSGRLRWLGHVHDQDLLTELWANAGVYIHGHSVGGTNPALLQALGSGAPTLALDTPFNREVLENSEMVYPQDPDLLASKIEAVLGDQELRIRMQDYGRSVIATRYSWDAVIESYEAALREAIVRRGLPHAHSASQ